MAYGRLRVYFGPDQSDSATPSRANTVTVPLGDILPALADAARSRRSWVNDFLDDEVTISSDLYEVLQAYQSYRRPGA